MAKHNLENVLKNLGRRVGELREKASLTQEELAEKLGVQKRWVSRIETGWDIPFTTLINLANALDVDLSEFLKKAETPTPGRGRPRRKKQTEKITLNK